MAIPLPDTGKSVMDLAGIDDILKAAAEKKAKGSVESLAREMDVTRALISGIEDQIKQLDKQKAEQLAKAAPLIARKAQVEDMREFIPEDQYKLAIQSLEDMSATIELQVEHIEARINNELSVQLFEHQTNFEELKKRMHSFPEKLRIQIVEPPVTPEQSEEVNDIKSLRERVKKSGVLERTSKKIIGIYGVLPGPNEELLRTTFEFAGFIHGASNQQDRILNAIKNRTVIGVVAWKFMADVNVMIKACSSAGIPFILTERSSKKYLLVEVAKGFGVAL